MTASTTRRSVLAAAGAASAAVTLAACGAEDSGGGSQDKGAGEGGGDDGGGEGGEVAKGELGKAADVPEGGGMVFKEQKVVVTCPSAGEYKAFSAICTHQGCSVKDVSGGTINCPCHNSKFDIADGSPTAGPAKKPLPPAKVQVKDGSIHLA